MARYDPLRDPDPADWLAHDEDEREDLAAAYHRERGIKVDNREMHARFHVIVENRLAEGDAVTRETLERLQREGLDRHDAVHAIGFVLADAMFGAARRAPVKDPEAAIQAALKRVTAAGWRRGR